MIDAWWFNNKQQTKDILQPEFFTPQTHFGLYAEIATDKKDLHVRLAAYIKDKVVFNNEYQIKEGNAEINTALGIIQFNTSVYEHVITPERLLVDIFAGCELLESQEVICEYITLSGRVEDFDGKPFPAAIILSRYGFNGFESGMGVWSGNDGKYEICLPKGIYNTLYADDASYGKTSLENWGWHMILDRDEEHNLKVGNSEVYSLCVWANNGGFSTLFIYFRPMALPLAQNPAEYATTINNREFKVSDLCPNLSPDDIKVTLNGKPLTVISLQKIMETGSDTALPGYVLQVQRDTGDLGKQTLIVEYNVKLKIDSGQQYAQSQGRTQFFFKDAFATTLR